MINQEYKLLNNGVKIPMVGMGLYKVESGKKAFETVSNALSVGYRHLDTAKRYNNEAEVGEALKKSGVNRDDVFITTKLWIDDYNDPIKACENSLKTMGLDYIDLYLWHWPLNNQGLDLWLVFEELLKKGWCRAIGVSNFSKVHLEKLLPSVRSKPVVNQVEFHPFLYQKDLLNYCNKNDISLEAYSPLTRGEKLFYERLLEIADKYNKSPAQILIRWGIEHNIIELPKSSNKERMKENLNVLDFTLNEADMRNIDSFNEDYRIFPDPNLIKL